MPDADAETANPETPIAPRTSYPPDGTVLPAYNRPPPQAHPGDADPLLVSRQVPFPTDEELKALMTAPPLSYLEARATVDGGVAPGGPYPERKFCEVCGYWGRVKCGKCGGRVCALDCLETHREECLRRYGL
jgi:zinc finger HIT domain-containing protein 1